jgi:hypothetical protein
MSEARHEFDDSDVITIEEPVRPPTTSEKVSVLLPAVIAFGGIVLMLVIVLFVVATRN